jgi:hypothetical protein
VVVLTVTLVALLCLPCVVAIILCADELLDRGARWWHGRRGLRRLDRHLDDDRPAPLPSADVRGAEAAGTQAPGAEVTGAEVTGARMPGESVDNPPARSGDTAAEPDDQPAGPDDDPTVPLTGVVVPGPTGEAPQPRTPGDDQAWVAPHGPAIEQIAADLRRLHRQRSAGPTTESLAWLLAVRRAYDDRLCLACTCLGVTEHLNELDGLDREIERVRVEGELQAAGLVLRTAADHQPPDRRG